MGGAAQLVTAKAGALAAERLAAQLLARELPGMRVDYTLEKVRAKDRLLDYLTHVPFLIIDH